MHCLTVSLAKGGAGLGTAFGEQKAIALITDVHWLPAWNARIHRVLSTTVTYDASRRVFEYTSRTDDGNPSRAQWRWQVTPISGQRSRIEVTWLGAPRTFWRHAVFARLRRHQLRDEVPTSLRALAACQAIGHRLCIRNGRWVLAAVGVG